MDQDNQKKGDLRDFAKKVWVAAGIIALATIVIFIIKGAFNVLLMILAGSLIAVYFHGLGDVIERNTQMKRWVCMLISVAGTFAILGVLLWFMGSKIQAQMVELNKELPAIVMEAEERLSHTDIGRKVLVYLSGDNTQKLVNSFQQLFRTSFGVIGDAYIILFIGMFFTMNPGIYLNGIIKLVPPGGKEDAQRVITRLSTVLKGWLKGMLAAMLIVGILSFIGLTVAGVRLSLALALIAGIMNFIPNFGPLIAMLPAAMMGLLDGTNIALIVVALYLLIQLIESNFITPMLLNRMINIPPAMIIISQVVMGAVSGGLGIILATPVLAVTIVLVDELYVRKQGTAA